MSKQHSEERWIVIGHRDCIEISNQPDDDIAHWFFGSDGFNDREEVVANAYRIVACVNACAGIDNTDLENVSYAELLESHQFHQKQSSELLKALKAARRAIRAIKREQGKWDHGRDLCIKAEKLATAAIAKATA